VITGQGMLSRLQAFAREISLSSMRHTLKLHGVVVGWSDLEKVEPELGRARGRFRPGLGYDLVQPVFRLYVEAVPRADTPTPDEAKLQRYYKSRDALQLELYDPDGRRVPTSTIHIADYTAADGECELDVLIADAAYWDRRSIAS
jgi:hypothetical protein